MNTTLGSLNSIHKNEDMYRNGLKYLGNKHKESCNCYFFQYILENIWNIFCPPKKTYQLYYNNPNDW